jgi:hypothetical protein
VKSLVTVFTAAAIACVHAAAGVSQDARAQRAEADAKEAQDNLRRIVVAMFAYHDAHGHFPDSAIRGACGTPLLSWRVALLPHLKEAELYHSFKLDEPWDSPHNKAQLKKMPAIYRLPGVKPKDDTTTFYRVFTGKGTVFEGRDGIRIGDIPDGLGNTLMVVEAAEGVTWTKPEDLVYAPDERLPKLGGLFRDGLFVAYCDGTVRLIRNDFDEQRMRLAIVRDDGYGFPWADGQP